MTRYGFGKRMDVDRFKQQGRGGKGLIATKFKNAQDRLVAFSQVSEDEQVLLITQKGITVRTSAAASVTPGGQGKTLHETTVP